MRGDRPSIVRKALEARMEVLRLAEDPRWQQRVAMAFVEMMMPAHLHSQATARGLSAKWAAGLRVGETYAITGDMFDLVVQAGSELPDDYIAEHHHLHADHGFVYLPRPIAEDHHLDTPLVDALTWHHGQGYSTRKGAVVSGIEVNLWARDPDVGYWPTGSDFLPYGLPSLGWRTYAHGVGRPREEIEQQLSNTSRFVLALQLFMRQELPAVHRWAAPRSDVKHLARLDLRIDTVQVVDLRRRHYVAHPDAEGTGRHQQVRSITRGHWQRFWIGPTHPQHPGGTEERVTVYLYRLPFWRGPEDGPVKPTGERVHVIRR